jgi:hypothetical protein
MLEMVLIESFYLFFPVFPDKIFLTARIHNLIIYVIRW